MFATCKMYLRANDSKTKVAAGAILLFSLPQYKIMMMMIMMIK